MLLEEAKRVLNKNGYVLVESLPKWAKKEPRVNVGDALNAGSKKIITIAKQLAPELDYNSEEVETLATKLFGKYMRSNGLDIKDLAVELINSIDDTYDVSDKKTNEEKITETANEIVDAAKLEHVTWIDKEAYYLASDLLGYTGMHYFNGKPTFEDCVDYLVDYYNKNK